VLRGSSCSAFVVVGGDGIGGVGAYFLTNLAL